MSRAILCLGLFFLLAENMWAQEPVRSLADLPTRVQRGDKVKVRLRDGTTVTGRFDNVSGSSLRLFPSGSAVREISGANVTEIRKQRPDSVWNGVLIGTAIGIGAGIVATSASCGGNDPECSAIASLAFIPTFGGGGAAIGALTDHFIHKYDSIYLGQAALDRARIRVSPLVAQNRRGLSISLSF
jgi:hypothetical protein